MTHHADTIEDRISGGHALRWTSCLFFVLALHVGIATALLRTVESVSTPAAPPALVLVDLPLDAVLPKADSIQSIAAQAVAEVVPQDAPEVDVATPQETVEELIEVDQEPSPDQPAEIVPEQITAAEPEEISDSEITVTEVVQPTETVVAEPLEQPKPKPKPKQKARAVQQSAADASVNSRQASGAGRSNPQALARYLSQVRATILRHRRAVPAGTRGRVTVRVAISRSGALSGIRIARSSGNASLDRTALSIVRRVGRVPRIPGSIRENSLVLNVPFTFSRR